MLALTANFCFLHTIQHGVRKAFHSDTLIAGQCFCVKNGKFLTSKMVQHWTTLFSTNYFKCLYTLLHTLRNGIVSQRNTGNILTITNIANCANDKRVQ